jgi:hypothetical protein
MISDNVEAGDLRDRPKHRSSYSTVEEDLAAGTVVVEGTALAVIDALLSRKAISKAPRAAGYRGSDFVLWRDAEVFGTAAISSGIGGSTDVFRTWSRGL